MVPGHKKSTSVQKVLAGDRLMGKLLKFGFDRLADTIDMVQLTHGKAEAERRIAHLSKEDRSSLIKEMRRIQSERYSGNHGR